MGALTHPQIPKLIDHFSIYDEMYYVMQQIKGKNLEEVLFEQKETFTEFDALLLVKPLLDILEYLHENLIFHCDIRAPNIILRNGTMYLIDFGLAKQLHPENKKEISKEKQGDFIELGECLLFILYSQFEGKTSRTKSWLEELTLSENTVMLLKRLLGIVEPYLNTGQIRIDIEKAMQSLT